MDGHAGSPPQHILGYTIRSRTRIYVSYIIPAALELTCYIAQTVADCAVSYEHFHSHQPNFGWATLSLILVPPVLTFIIVISSRDQWSNPKFKNRKHFIGYQAFCLLLFPFVAIYRLSRRIFWAIEALFQDDNNKERMFCLSQVEECSTCELYHLIQAYGQSAPQIILQLYHMLTQDLFRNFQTTNCQAISLVFSAIDLAAITTAYQRFESQKLAGRHYPWSAPQQVEVTKSKLAAAERLHKECERKKRESERTIASFPETDKIMANFKQRNSTEDSVATAENQKSNGADIVVSEEKTHAGKVQGLDEVDNDAVEETTALLHSQSIEGPEKNETDDQKISTKPKFRLQSIREEQKNLNDIEPLDTVPDSPAPAPPMLTPLRFSDPNDLPQFRTQMPDTTENNLNQRQQAREKRSSKTINQLEIFKEMLIVNAQLYIKENVPRPPKMLLTRIEPEHDQEDKHQLVTTPVTPKDVVDFFLPRPTKIVNGIQQDDFAGKTVAFFGWIAFVIMRMLSLATFCVFYPKAFFILISVHYFVMLAALFLESRFSGRLNRTLFYMLLAYVYIFVILEFRIKFKRIRLWFIFYFIITMTENVTTTLIWYSREEFESWWFGFIFDGIIYSGILFVASILVYYYLLKPKDVTLVVEDDDSSVVANATT